MTLDQIVRDPDCLTLSVSPEPGRKLSFRVLRSDDAPALGRYLEGLSAETRGWFAPHPFTAEVARKLCADLDYRQTLRLIALSGTGDQEEVAAYFILHLGTRKGEQDRYRGYGIVLDDRTDCTFAPSVADAWQNRGLGSALMPHVLEVARQLGFRRALLSGGAQTANVRALHFYEKFGFRKVGAFRTSVDNQDMIVEIPER